jgi:hypothetical protein
MVAFLKFFRWTIIATVIAVVAAGIYDGLDGIILCVLLGIMEVSLSFDNAVVNATVLRRMSERWQDRFLLYGIFIAVFGMRLIFPLLVVGIAAHLGPVEAIQLALEKGDPHVPGTYGYILLEAMPQIAAFGFTFLLMLFLDFAFEDRDIKWLRWLEAPLARVGKLDQLSVVITGTTLFVIATTLAKDPAIILASGLLGLVTYIAVNGLGNVIKKTGGIDEETSEELPEGIYGAAVNPKSGPSDLAKATGKAGFFLFMYLEVLDASFSFDGVIGAFAITSDPIIIALGLGVIGAMAVRSITIFMVRQRTLEAFVYLEHGAHWAIGALAVILLLASVGIHVDEIITGLLGVGFIVAAYISSVIRNKRLEKTPTKVEVNA